MRSKSECLNLMIGKLDRVEFCEEMAGSFSENLVVAKDGSVESITSYEARIKPKKRRSKGPALVFAFTEVERQKLLQEKASLAEYKKSAMAKSFSRIATFSYLKNLTLSGGATAQNSQHIDTSRIQDPPEPLVERVSDCSTIPASKPIQAHSYPGASALKSAMRGHRDDAGSRPGSKLHVKWASDLIECTKTNYLHSAEQKIACTKHVFSPNKELFSPNKEHGKLASDIFNN